MRCVCHSTQTAMSYVSAECLPTYLGYLCIETHNWFAKSSLSQCQYNELHKAINDGSQPMKIPSGCKSRWLYIKAAVENIIAQWLELKAHFKIARLTILLNYYLRRIQMEKTRILTFLQTIRADVEKSN